MTQNVTIIGSGNLAFHLAPALDNLGYQVQEVYSRNKKTAASLISRLYNASLVSSLDFQDSPSELFIIAVSDDAVSEICHEIILPEHAVAVHTSGALPMDILAFSAAAKFGVLYPLQSFSYKRKVDWQGIPVFIEANRTDTEQQLTILAKALTGNVHLLGSDKRRSLHLAAVFANNFTNHMMKIAADILQVNGQPFESLHPLLAETFNKALALHPDHAQTGPAKRHDYETLDSHLELLAENEELGELYRLISQHIADTYSRSE